MSTFLALLASFLLGCSFRELFFLETETAPSTLGFATHFTLTILSWLLYIFWPHH